MKEIIMDFIVELDVKNLMSDSFDWNKEVDTFLKNNDKAINYIRCCEKLKEEEALNFNSWLLNNGYMPYRDDLFIGKDKQLHFEDKLIQIYNDEVMNL